MCKRFLIIFFSTLILSCSSKNKIEDDIGNGDNKQSEPPTEYDPGDANDIDHDIQLYPESADDNGHEEGYAIENTMDRDKETGFNTPFGDPDLPAELEYFFNTDSVDVIDYLILYPLSGEGASGRFGETSVYLKSEGDDDYVKFEEYDFEKSSRPQQIVFPDGWKDPESIKIKVYSGSSNPIGNDVVSLGEIEFYKENPSLNAYLDIFEDKAATKLKPEITTEDIKEIDNEFIKNMAMAIHEGVYNDFRIGEFKSYPEPNEVADQNKTGTYGFYDNVTGIYIKWGTEMVVFMGDFDGDIYLRVVDHKNGFGGKDYALKPGVNRFKVKTEGLAYLVYQSGEGQNVKANFATGKVNGYFDITENSNNDWEKLLNNAEYSYFDVLGEKAMLTFTTDDFRNNTDDIETLVGLYDEIVEKEDRFLGLYKYDRVPKTRAYYRTNTDNPDMYMYTTSYHTEYNVDVMGKLTLIDKLQTNPWGVAHETGHIHQTEGLKWTGLTEVTVNIYAQYINTEFGNESNLLTQGGGDEYSNSYEKGFSQALDNVAHSKIEDGDIQLIPFWQLQLYFDKIKGDPDFYKDLHEYLREHDISSDPGQQQVNFVKIASEVANLDLSDFFESWGFLTTGSFEVEDYSNGTIEVNESMVETVKNYCTQFPKPSASIKYVTDSNIDTYKSEGKVSAGTASVLRGEVNITGSNNAVVYQQERDGEVLRVSTESSFEVGGFEDGDKFYAIGYDGEKKELAIQ